MRFAADVAEEGVLLWYVQCAFLQCGYEPFVVVVHVDDSLGPDDLCAGCSCLSRWLNGRQLRQAEHVACRLARLGLHP